MAQAIRGFQGAGGLVPDISQGLNFLTQGFGTPESRANAERERSKAEREVLAAERKRQVIGEQIDIITDPGAKPDRKEAALLRLSQLNPQVASSVRQTLERGDKQELLSAQQETDKGVREAFLLKKSSNKMKTLRELAAQKIAQKGGKGEDIQRLVDLSNFPPERLDLEVDKMLVQGADIQFLIKDALGPEATPSVQQQGVTNQQVSNVLALSQEQPTAEEGRAVIERVLANPSVSEDVKAGLRGVLPQAAEQQGIPGGEAIPPSQLTQNIETAQRRFGGQAGGGEFAKPAIKDFEPSSVARFQESGDAADLVPVAKKVIAPKAQTELGKAEKDFRNGLISAKQKNDIQDNILINSGLTRANKFSKSQPIVVRKDDGTFAFSMPVLDNRTGEASELTIPITGAPVTKLGETAEEITQRAIREAGGKTGSILSQKRIQTRIDEGTEAAKGTAVLRRSLSLLKEIQTGFTAGAVLKAKQAFGVEGANEAELSTNLARTVLAQLRPTFGAQFTEREGAALKAIEAGIGKSTAGNIRIIEQLLKIVERESKRGIEAAVSVKDFRSAADIQELLDFSLEIEPSGPQKIGRFEVKIK